MAQGKMSVILAIAVMLACTSAHGARISSSLISGSRNLLSVQFLLPDPTNQLTPDDHHYMSAFAHTMNALTFSTQGYLIAPATASKALTVLPSGSLGLMPLSSARNQQWRLGPINGKPGHHLYLPGTDGKPLCMDGDDTPKLGRTGKAVGCDGALASNGIAFNADSYARLCTAYGNNAAFTITVRDQPGFCLSRSLQWQPCSDDPQQLWCQVPPNALA